MTRRRAVQVFVGTAVAMCLAAWQLALHAQQPSAPAGRFNFQVVESFDARYLGDTPGHLGRGSLRDTRPDVALGDPVFRDGVRVGSVTSLTWDRTRESLQVEFGPEPFEADASGHPLRPVRITVGQDVWIPLGGAPAGATPRKAR